MFPVLITYLKNFLSELLIRFYFKQISSFDKFLQYFMFLRILFSFTFTKMVKYSVLIFLSVFCCVYFLTSNVVNKISIILSAPEPYINIFLYLFFLKIKITNIYGTSVRRTCRHPLRSSKLTSPFKCLCSELSLKCVFFLRLEISCAFIYLLLKLILNATKYTSNLTFRGPCVVMYAYNDSQRDALFLKFI